MTMHVFFKFILAQLLVFSCLHASYSSGLQSYGKQTLTSLQGNGVVKLSATKITRFLQVNGVLKAQGASIQAMQINGSATLNECLIEEASLICGAMTAKKSTFREKVSIASEEVLFFSCVLKSIVIIKPSKAKKTQVVKLKKGTTVSSSIIFEGGNGKVLVSRDSSIKGEVIGGELVFVE